MKLYAISWCPERGLPIPAQGKEFDRDESPVPDQAFFWDPDEAKRALAAHMEAALDYSVREHRRRTPADLEPPLSEAQLRGLLEKERSIEIYEVPAVPSEDQVESPASPDQDPPAGR
jgi:hypothetical protein